MIARFGLSPSSTSREHKFGAGAILAGDLGNTMVTIELARKQEKMPKGIYKKITGWSLNSGKKPSPNKLPVAKHVPTKFPKKILNFMRKIFMSSRSIYTLFASRFELTSSRRRNDCGAENIIVSPAPKPAVRKQICLLMLGASKK
mmetsp:Transcript_17994/g.23680  ORF Transcript_17994/g.23680 Transcript_17994/m.23680 type:complete len:145 (-) Transcript_17994:875-1309(-)